MAGKMKRRLGAAAVPCLAAVLGLGSAVAAVPAAAGAAVARVTGDARVDALIGRMTLEEKLTLLEGSQEAAATNQYEAGYLPGMPGWASRRCDWRTGRQGWRPGSRRWG